MSLNVHIDHDACLAHGDCAVVAPDVFVVDDVAKQVADAPDDVLIAAAQACPSVAIVLTDSETGEQVYP
ncbi:MAG TPA: ferredoxin [Solirubrobacteraceae bacterium]|jgi:ferredoxin|nr:ferredoxin [Solirubrobacteraceae bacterium]